jgi:hypothetical protein
MAVETGLSVITDAYLMAGIIGQGQTLSNEEVSLGLRRLNGMVSLWNTKRWLIWDLLTLGVSANGRTTPYFIGPGAADFPCSRRPDRIESAFVRQVFTGALPVDTRLTVWQSREQYNLNTLKANFVSYPSGIFLDTTWGVSGQGQIYIYPWPSAALYQIFISFKNSFPVFTAATLMANLPDQYLECIKLNLALRLRQNFGKGMKPDQALTMQAKDALNTVKNSNIQVPELMADPALVGRGTYNIYSDGTK